MGSPGPLTPSSGSPLRALARSLLTRRLWPTPSLTSLPSPSSVSSSSPPAMLATRFNSAFVQRSCWVHQCSVHEMGLLFTPTGCSGTPAALVSCPHAAWGPAVPSARLPQYLYLYGMRLTPTTAGRGSQPRELLSKI